MSNTLTKLRYRYWPDHVFGELLQKQWMETAVPLLVLLLTIAFFSSRIDNFISVANLSDTITVLTRGKVLAEGDYATLTKHPQVKEAYLGAGHE